MPAPQNYLLLVAVYRRTASRASIGVPVTETVSKELGQGRRWIDTQIVPHLDARRLVLPWPSSLKAIRNPWTDVAFRGRCVD
jgi:hypothetical protein